MEREYLFGLLVLLAVVGTVCDIWLGPTMRRRGLFQALLVVLYLAVLFSVPSCSSGGPDIDFEPPYRF